MTAQGINQETIQLSKVPHFDVGGSLHFVVNNQVQEQPPQSAQWKQLWSCCTWTCEAQGLSQTEPAGMHNVDLGSLDDEADIDTV